MTAGSRTESVVQKLQPREAGSLGAEIESLREQLEFFHLVFNHIHNGVVVTDINGYVTHFNEPYGRFLGVDPREQIGKHITEVVENSRMHIVAKTGRPEINVRHRIKDIDMVVQRIPIEKDGQVIAVFGHVMFKSVRDVGQLADKLSLLESKVKLYEEELSSLRSTRYTAESILGQSRAIKSLIKEALKAAANRLPVLITGESGTGKELFAQAIHHASNRRLRPFVRINCSTIPRDLFESELFGYEKGAFTGASSDGKPGKFELAHGGTLFLDEIGELPLEMQPKLLRVIEEKEFERVGGTRLLRSDFRLIAATNQNLEELLARRSFRKDLFYRLNVIPLHIPPLRERREDLAPLAMGLMARMTVHGGPAAREFTPQALNVMTGYDWPGNVREVQNVLERIMAAADSGPIQPDDLPFYLKSRSAATPGGLQLLREVMAKAERGALRDALILCKNNKARAARTLGIHRTLLYKKLKKHGLALSEEA
ncbi:MAG: sigma 54-interacting transcriptional regulator [Proteobacteria bacterium]|nr:sigma 54-interacting transcriptional regulator [Pseudomonadota bacterium]